MDNKNVFIAIALSMSVLLFWGAYFDKPKPIEENSIQQNVKNKNEETKNKIAPNINEVLEINSISRKESINKEKRVKIENNSISGSISLKGGIIDDVSFKKYKQNLKDKKDVVFLNPQNTENGYFVETGWTSIGNKIKVPSINSNWNVSGSNILSANSPVTLVWKNGEGVTFKKIIKLDQKYLFNISQIVENNTSSSIDLYPYAQITRNKIPDDIQNFYISHEGFISVLMKN